MTPIFAGVLSLAFTWGLLRNVGLIVRLVGNNVIEIFSKIIGLFIAAMGIEYIMRGALEYVVGGSPILVLV